MTDSNLRNEFSALVRMLEQRQARQKIALAETELQLASSRESYNRREQEIAKAKK